MTDVTVTTLSVYNSADSEPATVHVLSTPAGAPEHTAEAVTILRGYADEDGGFAGLPDDELEEAMQDNGWSIIYEGHTVTLPAAPTRSEDDPAAPVEHYGLTYAPDADGDPDTFADFAHGTLSWLGPKLGSDDGWYVELTVRERDEPGDFALSVVEGHLTTYDTRKRLATLWPTVDGRPDFTARGVQVHTPTLVHITIV